MQVPKVLSRHRSNNHGRSVVRAELVHSICKAGFIRFINMGGFNLNGIMTNRRRLIKSRVRVLRQRLRILISLLLLIRGSLRNIGDGTILRAKGDIGKA